MDVSQVLFIFLSKNITGRRMRSTEKDPVIQPPGAMHVLKCSWYCVRRRPPDEGRTLFSRLPQ